MPGGAHVAGTGSGTAIFKPVLLPLTTPQYCHSSWYAAGCMCGDRCNAIGPAHPGSFASEFGCVGTSSFEAMSATLSPKAWGVHADHEIWQQRSY